MTVKINHAKITNELEVSNIKLATRVRYILVIIIGMILSRIAPIGSGFKGASGEY
ncbi:hypothetical protein [Clostridium sp. KNHs205]|uniref:hypothetical protein n=1 Tax=Clostridium sp. KNHs205 TaxID=1449050 RepID=UPI000A450B7E|nr:hypothetical protein [Clostridium sp. KNHs205]